MRRRRWKKRWASSPWCLAPATPPAATWSPRACWKCSSRARPRAARISRRSRRLEHQHRRTARLAGQGQLPRRRYAVPAGPAPHGLAADRAQRHPLGRAGHAAGHGGDLLPARTAQRAVDPGGAAARRGAGLVVGRQGRHHRHAADGGAVQRHGWRFGGGHRRSGTAALCLPRPP
ncbi:hypothetical protein G6F59_015222 [Rhizopus arrhizus]|nr:hypothetical protein G6F59_015222 [Rhizopus arrhizus]